jgi:hypothetical protein
VPLQAGGDIIFSHGIEAVVLAISAGALANRHAGVDLGDAVVARRC